MTSENDHRLPRSVVPAHYALTLEPDLVAATFTGCVAIDVDVLEATDAVVVNGAELEVSGAELVHRKTGKRIALRTELDEAAERVVFRSAQAVEPGPWRLHADFRGILNDQLRGFYRSVFTDDAGTEHALATTQFEATDARRAFPCWDEPDLKATFAITLVVPGDLMAISCGPVEADETLADGRRRVRFRTTMKLPTYLLAFIVGPLEASAPVDVDGTPLRIVHVPGKAHLAGFAEEFGAFALRFFAGYYGIPYPGDKLDLVAIPDFASGAMENLGAVTFRESALLVDPAAATQSELQRVAAVIAHEIAHMWFGDLVTMRWWNGLWLNEAFATFMELVCVAAFRPEWRGWSSFAAERDNSMDTDALESTRPIEFPVASPDEADAMFDVITYSKGAAVLRMLQQYLGEETFRRGISLYLKTHEYGNTETSDLWDALKAESGEPVREIMASWIFQGGHPCVLVERDEGGYRLSQERFRFLGSSDASWQVPVLYRSDEGEGRFVLGEDRVVAAGNGFRVNHGGQGYYRTRYAGELGDEVVAGLAELAPDERFAVVADAWADTLAGAASGADFLALVARLGDERDLHVWEAALGGLGELARVVSSDLRPSLEAFVRDVLAPVADRVGWVPRDGESDLDRRFRSLVLRALGVLGADGATIAEARRLLSGLVGGAADLDGEVAAAVVDIVAADGDAADHGVFADAYGAARTPQEEMRYLRAMAAIPDAAVVPETIQMLLDGRIRSQNGMSVVARLIGNRVTGVKAWQVVKEHWDGLMSILPPYMARRILDFVHLRSEPDVAADVAEWLRSHPLPGGEQLAAQQMERLRVRVGLRERESGLSVPGARPGSG